MIAINNVEENRRNTAVDYAKAIAIFCVICAHCGAIPNDSSLLVTRSAMILAKLGSLGVSCFLLLSGALFSLKKEHFVTMIQKKVVIIGIPWIVSATAVYLYVALRHYPFSLRNWFMYCIGYGSYTYYLTILFLCFFIFSLPFMRKESALLICSAITILSVTVWPDKGFLTPYLDIFNWFGYFSFGIFICEKKSGFEWAIRKIYPARWFIYFMFIVLQHFVGVGYWGGAKPIVTLLGTLCIFLVSFALSQNEKNTWLIHVGDNSLFIYLWHMPLAGIIAHLFCYGFLVNFVLLRPVIILFLMVLVMKSLDMINSDILSKVVGYSRKSISRGLYAAKK